MLSDELRDWLSKAIVGVTPAEIAPTSFQYLDRQGNPIGPKDHGKCEFYYADVVNNREHNGNRIRLPESSMRRIEVWGVEIGTPEYLIGRWGFEMPISMEKGDYVELDCKDILS